MSSLQTHACLLKDSLQVGLLLGGCGCVLQLQSGPSLHHIQLLFCFYVLLSCIAGCYNTVQSGFEWHAQLHDSYAECNCVGCCCTPFRVL